MTNTKYISLNIVSSASLLLIKNEFIEGANFSSRACDFRQLLSSQAMRELNDSAWRLFAEEFKYPSTSIRAATDRDAIYRRLSITGDWE